MKDLSVLTPPFLMAAVVIIAIVAFLRYEMGRGHVDQADPDDNSAPGAERRTPSSFPFSWGKERACRRSDLELMWAPALRARVVPCGSRFEVDLGHWSPYWSS